MVVWSEDAQQVRVTPAGACALQERELRRFQAASGGGEIDRFEGLVLPPRVQRAAIAGSA